MSAPRRSPTAAAAYSRPWAPGRRSAAATAIRKIHVSDQGRFGFARIDAAEQGLEAMGYVVPNRALGRALWTQLQAATPGARATHLSLHRSCMSSRQDLVELHDRCGGERISIEAKLVVAADGFIPRCAMRSAWPTKAATMGRRR
jgi:2-polyprenyl-6-methoxyphenol hydroxylase-like FAD-dependent oxidoreductase